MSSACSAQLLGPPTGRFSPSRNSTFLPATLAQGTKKRHYSSKNERTKPNQNAGHQAGGRGAAARSGGGSLRRIRALAGVRGKAGGDQGDINVGALERVKGTRPGPFRTGPRRDQGYPVAPLARFSPKRQVRGCAGPSGSPQTVPPRSQKGCARDG